MRPFRGGTLLLAAIACTAALAPPADAVQQRLVTLAARSCPSYEAITANRARNNIMESLEDLGRDTPYGVGGVPLNVDPAIEADVQPTCTPIANWQFTLGTGYQTRAVPGVWGSLSKVLGPFSPTVVTDAQVPLRDGAGMPIPGSSIGGATTIVLTEEQSSRATTPSKLWIQGGTPALPITDPETYAFGALRCATDNLNGDNVEWISYPPDTVHVFCFAYYVKPAPTSGTITVVKETTLPADTAPQRVRFTGDISYDNGEFFLTASNGNPGRQSFIRAAGRTWSFREELLPLAALTDLTCVSATGTSMSTTDLDEGAASVTLAAGDTVTCTYENRFRPPPAGLAIRKVSLGGVGSFGFSLEGEGRTANASATTTEPGIAAIAEPSAEVADLPSGTYVVDEDAPPNRGGAWSLEQVRCVPGGDVEPVGQRVVLRLIRGPSTACTFTNRFTPAGRITLRKITLGGIANTRFQIRPEFGGRRPEREQFAATREPGEAVTATGDKLSEIPIGEYSIQETIGGTSRWEVAAVMCDGRPVPSIAGRIVIELTDRDATRDCLWVNARIADGDPPVPAPLPPGPIAPPVEVPPQGGIAGAAVASPVANLVVTKRARPRRVRLGGRVRYTVVVVNRGPDPADDVTVVESGDPARRGALPLQSSRGSCRRRPPRYCHIGTLAPGERATVRVALRTRRTGAFLNVVAVNSSTGQRSRRGKQARARIVVTAPGVLRFTG